MQENSSLHPLRSVASKPKIKEGVRGRDQKRRLSRTADASSESVFRFTLFLCLSLSLSPETPQKISLLVKTDRWLQNLFKSTRPPRPPPSPFASLLETRLKERLQIEIQARTRVLDLELLQNLGMQDSEDSDLNVSRA